MRVRLYLFIFFPCFVWIYTIELVYSGALADSCPRTSLLSFIEIMASKQVQQKISPALSQEFSAGMIKFTMDLYNLFVDGNENIFMSPYSVCAALLLANLGAKGATETQIRTALGMDKLTFEQTHDQYKQLQESLNSKTTKKTTLAVANRMFSKLGLKIVPKYLSDSNLYYGSDLQLLDFLGDAEGSRKTINTWVEKQTNDKIKDLLPSGTINAMSLVVLVNAIYFKGNWAKKFDSKRTEKTDFHVSKDSTVKVDMMQEKAKMRFIRNEKLKFAGIELPYEEGNLAMVVLLPNEIDGLKDLEKRLQGDFLANFLTELRSSYKPEVILGLPKFKLTATYDLKGALPQLKILNIFDGTKSDLSGMIEGQPDAHVSEVIHKAFIDVNEEGTEAAAATAMMIRCMAMPAPPERFRADHPFMFLIVDNDTGTVLFLGRYTKPPS